MIVDVKEGKTMCDRQAVITQLIRDTAKSFPPGKDTLGYVTVALSQDPEFDGFDIYEVEAIVRQTLTPPCR